MPGKHRREQTQGLLHTPTYSCVPLVVEDQHKILTFNGCHSTLILALLNPKLNYHTVGILSERNDQ